jgi:hypothetical protein
MLVFRTAPAHSGEAAMILARWYQDVVQLVYKAADIPELDELEALLKSSSEKDRDWPGIRDLIAERRRELEQRAKDHPPGSGS